MNINKSVNIIVGLLVMAVAGACSSADAGEDKWVAEETYFAMPAEQGEIINSEKQSFTVQTVVEGLKTPWGIAFLPDGKVLITERGGTLRLVENGELLPDPVEGTPEVFARGQGGMLDLELHPDYESNGWIYLSYSILNEEGDANTGLMRVRLDGNSLTDQEVIFEGSPFSESGLHFGGRIEFDREGYLYLTVGERGTMENAQMLTNYSGKVMRLHDDGNIPDDNPFVNDENALPAIYSYGHRNPQGLVLHPETGKLWEHEHGPKGGDEINIIQAGANYGWPEITYGVNYDDSIITEDTVKAGMEQPLHFWDPSIAPSGMAFSASDHYLGWNGDLFVGSLKFGYVNRCEIQDGKVVAEEKLLEGVGRVREVKMGPDGYLYVLEENGGQVLRLLPAEV